MKFFPILTVTFLCLAAARLRGQDAALPQPDTQNPSGAVSPSPLPSVPPPVLIPEELLRRPDIGVTPAPNVSTIPQLDDSFKPAPLSPAALRYQLSIEWRKLRNRVQNDPKVKAALAHAEGAPNDLEKRKRLAKFYEFYYGKMIALADTPELKNFIKDRRNDYLVALKQPRVRPEAPSSAAEAGSSPAATSLPSIAPGLSASPSPTPTPSSHFPSMIGAPSPGRP